MPTPYDYTIKISDLDLLETLDRTDEIIIVDKNDLSASPEGTEKKINPRTFVEQSPVRPATNLTVEKTVSQWIGEFNDSIDDVVQAVQPASPTQAGTMRLASDAETINKVRGDVALSPSNLAALGATETIAGLVRLLAPVDVLTAPMDDRSAISPRAFFQGIMGDSVIGTDSFVFKIPIKNNAGDVLMQLTLQYGEREATSVPTDNRPESNFNHSHPFVDVGVTFPQPFENKCLMVIPMGYNVNDVYEEGTEFTFREFSSTESSAVIRGSRIEGVNNTGERVGVKYIAIGF